jgi:adenosylhomocysteine nucleosidase
MRRFRREEWPRAVAYSESAWEYQAGKWSKDGFKIAPVQIPLRAQTRVELEQVCQDDNIIGHLEAGFPAGKARPTVARRPSLQPLATGSAVVAQDTFLRHIVDQHRKLAGIDMESYGLYFACHENGDETMHYFACKAVVDQADGTKDDNLHEYGSFVSAKLTLLCIERLLSIGL